MTPKTIKSVDQEKQDTFSCKHEITLKSMEFSEGDEQLCLLTVYLSHIMFVFIICLSFFLPFIHTFHLFLDFVIHLCSSCLFECMCNQGSR